MPSKLAFLGMGTMGSPMSINIHRQHPDQVYVWNRTQTRPGLDNARTAGCHVCPSIKDAVVDADVVITCLGDVHDVQQVLLGPSGVSCHAPAGAVLIDTSTIGPLAAREIGSELASKGLRFLDAPVTGGDIGAVSGTLTMMVGGDPQVLSEVMPVLRSMASRVHHCGPLGSGQALKLINQALCAIHMVALSEAITLSHHLGVSPSQVIEVCSQGAAGSWALTNLGPKITQNDLQGGFALKHMLKDIRLTEEADERATITLPGLQVAKAKFQEAARLTSDQFATQAMITTYDT